jgi:hypothetical protein
VPSAGSIGARSPTHYSAQPREPGLRLSGIGRKRACMALAIVAVGARPGAINERHFPSGFRQALARPAARRARTDNNGVEARLRIIGHDFAPEDALRSPPDSPPERKRRIVTSERGTAHGDMTPVTANFPSPCGEEWAVAPSPSSVPPLARISSPETPKPTNGSATSRRSKRHAPRLNLQSGSVDLFSTFAPFSLDRWPSPSGRGCPDLLGTSEGKSRRVAEQLCTTLPHRLCYTL